MEKEPDIIIEDCPPMPGEEPGPGDVVIPFPRRQNREDRTMEMNVSIKEGMRITADMLEGICLPVKFAEAISVISTAVNNLNNMVRAIEATEQKQAGGEKGGEAVPVPAISPASAAEDMQPEAAPEAGEG